MVGCLTFAGRLESVGHKWLAASQFRPRPPTKCSPEAVRVQIVIGSKKSYFIFVNYHGICADSMIDAFNMAFRNCKDGG